MLKTRMRSKRRRRSAIIREGFDKVCLCKVADGNIHKFSALCPHLKCHSALESDMRRSSWDCPCHGSR
ncbi:MAG: Rieske 2Fe-2S domain-containing protein [Ignavibacteria bacterium]|nr:Rieske 2Fe-2S domain-containing protein [Ignavibacteria bacterium]